MKGLYRQQGAMRNIFWLLGLAALAVALALLVGRNQAMVTLFWPPYRLDASFNFVLSVTLLVFVLVYLALRGAAMLRELPQRARRWRHQQLERSVVGAVADALTHQLAGRFVRAQAAGLSALEQLNGSPAVQWPQRAQLQLLAHLLVAEAAQSLQNRSTRDEHLQAALHPKLASAQSAARDGVLLRAVRWAIEDRDVQAARSHLALLPQGTARRIQALRLKLRVARMGRVTQEALETARLLAKHRAFSPEVARSILRSLALDALKESHDLSQLHAVWARLDKSEQAMPELVLAALAQANRLDDKGGSGESGESSAQAMIEAWLDALWPQFTSLDAPQQRQFALALEPALLRLDARWLAHLEQSQRQWPNNAYLQYLTGQACRYRGLWGKAAQLLGQASHGLDEPALLRRTWCALAQLAEERGDEVAAQSAWKRAALTPDA